MNLVSTSLCHLVQSRTSFTCKLIMLLLLVAFFLAGAVALIWIARRWRLSERAVGGIALVGGLALFWAAVKLAGLICDWAGWARYG